MPLKVSLIFLFEEKKNDGRKKVNIVNRQGHLIKKINVLCLLVSIYLVTASKGMDVILSTMDNVYYFGLGVRLFQSYARTCLMWII
jgi:hypothetical protein